MLQSNSFKDQVCRTDKTSRADYSTGQQYNDWLIGLYECCNLTLRPRVSLECSAYNSLIGILSVDNIIGEDFCFYHLEKEKALFPVCVRRHGVINDLGG